MKKPPKPLSRLHAVIAELIEIHELTLTPLVPTPISGHLGDAIQSVMLAQQELLFPADDNAPVKSKKPKERQTLIETAPGENGQPKPPPVTAR